MPKPTFSNPLDESELFPVDAPVASGAETREEYLRRGRSGSTKVRNQLIQQPRTQDRGRSQPAMLPRFARNHRALILYLGLLTNWPWLSRGDKALRADAWIRFLTSEEPGALTWTPQSLSHAWGVLDELNLVERDYESRLRLITPRHESGSGADYTPPDGKGSDTYFVIPGAFWTHDYFATLSWPALAVLLVLLKETGGRPSAELPIDRAEAFYGISRTTAEKGLAELRRKGLVQSKLRWVPDFEATQGRRHASLHAPLGPFSYAARKEIQTTAKSRRDKVSLKTAKEVTDDDDDGQIREE
jgi:hypothetical protein